MPAWVPSRFDPSFVLLERIGSQYKDQLHYSVSDDSAKASFTKETLKSSSSAEIDPYHVPPTDFQRLFKQTTETFQYKELVKRIEDISCDFECCSIDTFQQEDITVPYLESVVNQIEDEIVSPGADFKWIPFIDIEQERVIDEFCRRQRKYEEAWGAIPKFSESEVYYENTQAHKLSSPRHARTKKTWSQLQETGSDKQLFSELRRTLATVHIRNSDKQDCYKGEAEAKETSNGVAAISQFQLFGNLFYSKLHTGRSAWNKRSRSSNTKPTEERPEYKESEGKLDNKNTLVDNGKDKDIEVKDSGAITETSDFIVMSNDVSESSGKFRKPLPTNDNIKTLSLVVSNEKAAQNKYIQNWLNTVSKTWENMNANESSRFNEDNRPEEYCLSVSSADLESVTKGDVDTMPPENTGFPLESESIPLPSSDESSDQQELIEFNCRPKSSKWNLTNWFKLQKPTLKTPEDIEDELSRTLLLIEQKKQILLSEEPSQRGDEFRSVMQSEINNLEIEKQQLEKKLYLQQVDYVIDIAEREVLTYMSSSSHSNSHVNHN